MASDTATLDQPSGHAPKAARRERQWGIRLIEGAYVMLLGLLTVKLIYALITPLPSPETIPVAAGGPTRAVDLTVLSRFDPFIGVVPPPTTTTYTEARETQLNLKLLGVVYTEEGAQASATIRSERGEQRPYFVGDRVADRVTIRDILPEQVILLRNGVAETLSLENREPAQRNEPSSGAMRSGAPTSPVAAAGTLAEAVQLRPGRNGGLALYPGTNPTLFEASGLIAGDRLISVDGRGFSELVGKDPAAIADMLLGRPVTLSIERAGQPLDIRVDLTEYLP